MKIGGDENRYRKVEPISEIASNSERKEPEFEKKKGRNEKSAGKSSNLPANSTVGQVLDIVA